FRSSKPPGGAASTGTGVRRAGRGAAICRPIRCLSPIYRAKVMACKQESRKTVGNVKKFGCSEKSTPARQNPRHCDGPMETPAPHTKQGGASDQRKNRQIRIALMRDRCII